MSRNWWLRQREKWSGPLYVHAMRAVHRFGMCYPEPSAVEPERVWCHWCGMRGRRG